MTNGNSAAHEPEFIEEWCQQVFKRDHNFPSAVERAAYQEGYQRALSVCADGGKDSSDARDMADFIAEDGLSEQFRIWRECRDAAIAGENTAPQAECAPREAQPVYLVSSEGRFWQIVSEPVWINWQADYRNVLYTAPREAQPDGWKLMPMIPTVEMTVAALAVTDSPCTAYALFFDAAPTPERADAEKDAARYREVRRRAYLWGIDNPTPEELDAQVDAILPANKEPQP